jgi:hypothetical protein
MGLMDLFSKAKPAVEQPTAVEYVEWLLLYMMRTSRNELTIDTSRTLSRSVPDAKDFPPPCLPDAQAVVNRLKILSGVNPVIKQKGVGGTFERSRTRLTLTFTTQFQEDAEKSVCTIQLRMQGKNP